MLDAEVVLNRQFGVCYMFGNKIYCDARITEKNKHVYKK